MWLRQLAGLRPRLMAALVVTSAVTLGAAALTLLPPLRDRLRTESVRTTEVAVGGELSSFASAVKDPRCRRLPGLVSDLERATGADVYVVDAVPRPICELTDPGAGDDLLVQTTLTDGVPEQLVKSVGGEDLEVVVALAPSARDLPTHALIVRKRLSDVAGAVDEVRDAFIKAALVGLAAALVLGLGLAATLSRRLARLRRAALRVTREGPGAPRPADDGRDEIGDLSRSFGAMQSSLLRQEQARRAFVATASHELRTPLTSLQGMLELLDDDLREGRVDLPDAQAQVSAAQGELRRLESLATELLDLSRLDAGTPLRVEPVELGELCRAVTAEFALRAERAGVPIDYVPPMGPCWGRGDPGAVVQILRILLDNALRFSPAAQPVRVEAGYRGDVAFVGVSDHGPGVPEDERELIFERFQRGTRTGGEGGFGLGLAIGRELAVRQGGSLRLDASRRGVTRFVCELSIELPAGGAHA